jgi:hypothetical protein
MFVLGFLLAALPAAGAAPPELRQTTSPARHSACERLHPGPLAYGWPIRPFHRQHPIRGNFGDPRTVAETGGLGSDTLLTAGSFTFHNGIDISADTGTPVYPVISGTARIGYADEVIVVTADDRVFQYFHVRPAVAAGQRVVADRTVVGTVLPRWLHVHLSEIDGFRIHNPVDFGHLEPYRDHTVPIVDAIEFSAESGESVEPDVLRGLIQITAEASDTPALPAPGEWFGFPVAPALVAWRLATATGRVVLPWQVVADFRHTEPPNQDFWAVYAAGTYQNFPVFGTHYFFRHAGRYRFRLTSRPLNTRALPNGTYVVTVAASDVCGNRGTASDTVRIRN